MIGAIKDSICSVTVLCFFFIHNYQPPHAPLFAFNNALFSQQYVIDKLQGRLLFNRILDIGFSGHSFRKNTAHHILNNSILDKDIQKLDR